MKLLDPINYMVEREHVERINDILKQINTDDEGVFEIAKNACSNNPTIRFAYGNILSTIRKQVVMNRLEIYWKEVADKLANDHNGVG